MTFPHPQQQPHPSAQGYPQPHPYPNTHPYPSAQPYPQPHAYQGPYGSPGQFPGQPGPPGPAGHVCQVCGAQPAAGVTIRSHQGVVVIMRTVTRRGVFCRTCGLSLYRQMTSDTLVTGWWGLLSFFVTPFVVLGNVLGARGALRRLPEPYGASRQPLDPGKRVLFRGPAMLILTPIALFLLAIPALVVIGLVVGDGDKPVALSVGDCVRNSAEWPEQRLEKVGCGSPLAEYRVAESASCGPRDYLLHAEYIVDSPNPGSCVKRL